MGNLSKENEDGSELEIIADVMTGIPINESRRAAFVCSSTGTSRSF